jgi:hypothetical protein
MQETFGQMRTPIALISTAPAAHASFMPLLDSPVLHEFRNMPTVVSHVRRQQDQQLW